MTDEQMRHEQLIEKLDGINATIAIFGIFLLLPMWVIVLLLARLVAK